MGQTASRERFDVSIVVPVFNEEESLPHLQERLVQALDALGRSWEIVYVDDGSKDGSLAILRRFAHTDRRVKVVAFRRNFGQTAAMDAGFRHARGDVLIPMDADLQNDPADISRLLAKMEEGYDVVSGWRRDRKDKYLTRILPSRIANRLISKITGVHLHDYGCTLTAYRREIMKDVHLYGEMHRFIPVWANAAGARIVERVVNHRPRIHGKSKYGLWRTVKVVLDLMTVTFLTKYNTRPMYIFGGTGFVLSVLSAISVLVMAVSGIATGDLRWNSPWPILAALFGVLAIQSVLLGLMMEMLMRTYYESQGKGPYAIRRVVNGRRHIPLSAAPDVYTGS